MWDGNKHLLNPVVMLQAGSAEIDRYFNIEMTNAKDELA